ncbi:ATP-binding cassette domain-containing protein [candidate division WOR-3 bacterium]|nr:ATP-binding cassette domain-containing protein [candidate division WOR-3 bacterium]
MEVVLKDVSFYYKSGNVKGEEVLKGINLEFQENKCYLLTGPCGSGKTTLALLLKGLLDPTSGKIFVKDDSIPLSSFQRSIGISFQFPEEQFFKETVEEEVAFGPTMLGLKDIGKKVKNSLDSVGLPYKKFSSSFPLDLSFGEQRRLAIASIIACEPSWYILDEPTAGLDIEGRDKVVELIKNLTKSKKTIIIITQELGLFIDLCDEIIFLEEGTVKLKANIKAFLEDESLDGLEISLPYHNRVLRILKKRGWDIKVSITNPQEAADVIADYEL